MLKYETGELSTDQKMQVLATDGDLGTLIFVPDSTDGTPPKIDADIETKSLSERLRSVMFVYWKQQGEPEGVFNVWRAKAMEKHIQAYKDKLHD